MSLFHLLQHSSTDINSEQDLSKLPVRVLHALTQSVSAAAVAQLEQAGLTAEAAYSSVDELWAQNLRPLRPETLRRLRCACWVTRTAKIALGSRRARTCARHAHAAIFWARVSGIMSAEQIHEALLTQLQQL